VNHTYRLVRAADGRTVAVAETVRGAGKGRRGGTSAAGAHAGCRAHALCVLALALAAAFPARAVNWTGTGGDDDWFNGANWEGSAVPGSGQQFRIDNGATVRIASGNAVADGAMTGGGQSTVGDSGTGHLEISNGGTLASSDLAIGLMPGSTGSVTVRGIGSALNDAGLLRVTSGTLSIRDGGTVTAASTYVGPTAASDTSTVAVSGAGSTWSLTGALLVSGAGTGGIMDIGAGGRVVSNIGRIGLNISPNHSGTVTVSGTGSAWEISAYLHIGTFNTGTLNISAGGTVTTGQTIYIGIGSTSTVNVTDGGRLTTGDEVVLSAGAPARGTLNIGNGGAAGLVSAVNGISGANGGGSVNFNHTDADYHFTSDGTSSGTVNVMRDNLAVTLTGGGKTTLAGDSNYTGGTALNAGTLGVGHNNALGTGRLTMAANTALQQAGSTPLTLGNAITLNGAAMVDVPDSNFSLTLQGGISGSGGLTKTGGGNLFIGGAGSNYTGATSINAGAIWSTADNSLPAASDFTVASGAALALGGASQVIGSLAGDGTAVGGSMGITTLTTGGSGATTTFGGRLQNGWGTLALVKTGNGTMTLSGASTHTGGTTVNGGTLSVNGSITGNTTVNSGGALGGTGTVGNVMVASGGVLAPGNSIGTLNVVGDLTFAPGSIYRVEVDAAGATDRVNASGAITINGGTVDVQAGGGSYQRNTRYAILTSGGALTGTFSNATTNLAFLTPTLVYEANAVQLELQNNELAYAAVARTPNQSAVGTYLGSFANAPGNAQAAQLIQQIDNMTADQARATFESLSGSAHASASQAALAAGRDFSSMLAARNGFGTAGLGGATTTTANWSRTLYANADTSRYDPAITSDTLAQGVAPRSLDTAETASERGLWVQTLGSGGRIDSDGNAAGSRYRSNGLVFGYDQPVADRWVAGAAAGYGRSWWNTTSGSAASGRLESPQAGLYARYAGEGWRLRVDGTLASHSFTTDRTVTIGAASSAAHSRHSGREWSLGAQAETTVQMGDWQLKPVAGVRHTQLKEGGFTETGGGAGNLTVAGRTSQSTLLSAGMHFARTINDGKGQLELRAVASHLAGDVDSPVTASIAGQAGSFTANGVPLKRNALALGATVTGQLARSVSAYLDANYEHRGSGQNAYRLTAGMRVAF
jgi:outer membrane autotransporter protein